MLGRLVWNLITLASVAVLVGVGYYFINEYQTVQRRQSTVVDLRRLEAEEGPCAAFLSATSLGTDLDFALLRNVESLREQFALRIVGGEDRKSQKALLGASREGLISPMGCEQMRLLADMGEVHPVLALLRFTREKDPCADAAALDRIISGLGSHRALLLRGLMENVARLRCLSAPMSRRVAMHVAAMAHDDPQVFDDLDILRVAAFMHRWAPLQAAQVGCRIAASGVISRLGNALGCTPHQRRHVLTRYRYPHAIAASQSAPVLPAGSDVILLHEEDGRCEVRPAEGPGRVLTVACDDLQLLSELDVAVRIEKIGFGAARADLIAGVARYSGASGQTGRSSEPPPMEQWYVFDRTGRPLGTTPVVRLQEIAEEVGEDLPAHPLRASCKQDGAEYCYDVDWSQLVGKTNGDPVVYLSRPLDVFVRETSLSGEAALQMFREAFGRSPASGAVVRIFPMAGGARLVVEGEPDGFDLRWQADNGKPWRGQAFGTQEGGRVPPAARLLAAMDLQRDGRPELVIQRWRRVESRGEIKDATDEIHLVHLAAGDRFETLTRLTIHEYRN